MTKKIVSILSCMTIILVMITVSCTSVFAKSTEDDSCKNGETIAILQTNYGDIAIKFFDDIAPKACENFQGLAKEGKYDDTIFHRVISNFMIQGGDFENFNGTGGSSIWGTEFENEVDDDILNVRGSIAMANRGPDTNTSQFFINAVDNAHLDGQYTVFGFVISGMDVVDMIENAPKNGETPINTVSLEKVTVTKYSKDTIAKLKPAVDPYNGQTTATTTAATTAVTTAVTTTTDANASTSDSSDWKIVFIVIGVFVVLIGGGIAYSVITSNIKKKKKAQAKAEYMEAHKYDKNKKKSNKR